MKQTKWYCVLVLVLMISSCKSFGGNVGTGDAAGKLAGKIIAGMIGKIGRGSSGSTQISTYTQQKEYFNVNLEYYDEIKKKSHGYLIIDFSDDIKRDEQYPFTHNIASLYPGNDMTKWKSVISLNGKAYIDGVFSLNTYIKIPIPAGKNSIQYIIRNEGTKFIFMNKTVSDQTFSVKKNGKYYTKIYTFDDEGLKYHTESNNACLSLFGRFVYLRDMALMPINEFGKHSKLYSSKYRL